MLYAAIKARLKSKPGWYGKNAASIRGVTEETTTGVHRLYMMAKEGKLLWPAINVNDSVTKSKFDNLYGCRESLVDGIRRGTDVMMAGKVAMVAGFGDVGKGSAASLRNAGCRVMVSEIDPICALAGGDGRLRGDDDGRRRAARRHFRHRDRQCRRHHPRPHARHARSGDRLPTSAISIRRSRSSSLRNYKWNNVKPQVDEIEFPDGKKIILLSEGRLVNLGNATGHPSFVMSASFTNQTLAQIELFTKPGAVQEAGLHPAQAPRREGRLAASGQDRGEAHQDDARAVEIPRRAAAGALQGGPVPVLTASRRTDERVASGAFAVRDALSACPCDILINIRTSPPCRTPIRLPTSPVSWQHFFASASHAAVPNRIFRQDVVALLLRHLPSPRMGSRPRCHFGHLMMQSNDFSALSIA